LKDSLSQLCDLTADVPQGSVLGPLLFVVYINDITDDIIGFGRFFADYTSIGHFASDEASFKKLRNIDNLNDWYEKWLLKLNSNKTDIMIFSKNIKPDFAFDFGGVSIAPVDTHKRLGVTVRNDCKWNNPVDILIEKTSKQVNAFRKLKFQLKSVSFEKIYLTYICPILEYLPEVWVSCG